MDARKKYIEKNNLNSKDKNAANTKILTQHDTSASTAQSNT